MSNRRLTHLSLLIAAVCAVADVLVFVGDVPGGGPAWIVTVVAIVLADAALATPTRWSLAVIVAAVAVNAGSAMLLGGPETLSVNEAGLLVASYRAGAWLHGRKAAAALVTVIAGLVVAHATRGIALDWTVAVSAVKFGLVTWLAGRYTTALRGHLDELRRRAEDQERDARERVGRAVAEERAAIARDLHDVITHHVSAINVHAGAARLRLTATADPAALTSLRHVEDTSRSALGDLRHMLDVLHGQPAPDGERPGLDRVDDLLHGFRAAGVPVRLRHVGTPNELPGTLDVALYRIVQEMLTNALRHGHGGPVDVTVRHTPATVEVETINPYRETAAAGTGRGLAGIADRVHAFGGLVRSGPEPGGRTWTTTVTVDLENLP
ncbi:sensor histidine kinase [Actinoplanes derwentensis]|uniref:histidine kinase n=1 Tax=Actinoplanes derwentensis TaxID=113562 RepID=A0A1H1U6S7_9ACTN|nr:histidine kinase [Actinoplanes derwentensis]GID85213.1 two-component sensor histidine kinase [Actinoplanes derwentensis]SDS68053.1 Signal transduction histidine kinase [Actinoplanes derwentensis]